MAISSLIQNLEQTSSVVPTVKFQVYEIQSGPVVIKVHVPLENSELFEKEYDKLSEVNAKTLKELLAQVGGYTKV
jgi:hypothetical protein